MCTFYFNAFESENWHFKFYSNLESSSEVAFMIENVIIPPMTEAYVCPMFSLIVCMVVLSTLSLGSGGSRQQ